MVCSEGNKISFLLSESVVNLQFNLLEMEKKYQQNRAKILL